jgi:hypothetical protein
MDSALMREDRRLDISPLPTKEKVKNKHVQEVDELIATTVKETLFHYIKSNALERTVEKCMNKEMARSSWDMNLEEPCEGMSKEDVAMAMKRNVSAMICRGNIEVVGNHIVNAIDFDEIKSVAMETILKKQVKARKSDGMGGGMTSGRRRKMTVVAGNVNR